MWFFLLLPLFAQAQITLEDVDLSEIQELEKKRPTLEQINSESEIEQSLNRRKYRPPNRTIPLSEIKKSGFSYGAIGEKKTLYGLDGKPDRLTTEHFYTRFYRLEDEHGYRYVINRDGSCTYKIKSDFIEDVKEEIDLYVPPNKYTPAPLNITKAEFDKNLKIKPEFSFYFGMVNGSYMQDLFNDGQAKKGLSTQYGIHAATGWDLPVQTGLVLHYEKTTYSLAGNGKAVYSSFSLGPQFKSKDVEVFGSPWRAQMQFRVSPLSRVDAETALSEATFKFNSADLLVSVEHPVKNNFGEFVLGVFFQSQWLNIKDQSQIVQVSPSNEINKTFGLSLGQVFE